MVARSPWLEVSVLQGLEAIRDARSWRIQHSHIVDEARVCKEPLVIRGRFFDHRTVIFDDLHRYLPVELEILQHKRVSLIGHFVNKKETLSSPLKRPLSQHILSTRSGKWGTLWCVSYPFLVRRLDGFFRGDDSLPDSSNRLISQRTKAHFLGRLHNLLD